ncbi:unnamed protein product [Commensalibacter communis]|nr:unnamed protein product [Commensalibacter communis]CAI3944745.1 unnamed protein product [Commensalibacter communis]
MSDETKDETETEETKGKKKGNQSQSTESGSGNKELEGAGGIGGMGDTAGIPNRSKEGDTTLSLTEAVSKPIDPMVNIGCKQPGGIIIDIPSRAAFKLNYGFNRHNKSIWGMIEDTGRYDDLIKPEIIYLSKNG